MAKGFLYSSVTNHLFNIKSPAYFLPLAVFFSQTLFSEPKNFRNENTIFERLQNSLDFLRHELANQNSEMNGLEEKIESQQDTIESLKAHIDSFSKKGEKLMKGSMGTIDQKLEQAESALKGLASDLSLLKTHFEEEAKRFDDSQKKIKALEAGLAEEKEKTKHLNLAVNAILEALNLEDSPQSEKAFVHEVKSGDSLGLIAKKYKISSKQLKELNNLKSDTIFVGQKLKIPEKK